MFIGNSVVLQKKSLMNKAEGDRCCGFDLLLRKRMCCVEMFSKVTESVIVH